MTEAEEAAEADRRYRAALAKLDPEEPGISRQESVARMNAQRVITYGPGWLAMVRAKAKLWPERLADDERLALAANEPDPPPDDGLASESTH